REAAVNTIAQGMSLVSASPVVTTLVCFFVSHTRLRVQHNTRHSLRPLLFEGRRCCITRARSRRGNAKVCLGGLFEN
ncbi:MAG TPA: hypothetical protein VMJ52_20080, partial [Xanthobacteraceae bacterium]|nr:hypothetical protein [Xanthobacteraceae bacterium]